MKLQRAETSFIFKTKEMTLVYDMNAISRIERSMGTRAFYEAIGSGEDKLSFDLLRVGLCEGLRWKRKSITEDKAGMIIQEADDIAPIIKAVYEGIGAWAQKLGGDSESTGESEGESDEGSNEDPFGPGKE